MKDAKTTAREKLLDAALLEIRTKGFTAMTVDDLCKAAGVTKGAFFYHFESKDALGVAAADYWSETTSALFRDAPYHQPHDPLDRVLAYVDFRRELIAGDIPEFTCVVGTMAQEVHATRPDIRDACGASIYGHAETLEADIAEAMAAHGINGEWTAKSLALHTQAVLQGGFILAKSGGGAQAAVNSVDHLRRYIELLFATPAQTGKAA